MRTTARRASTEQVRGGVYPHLIALSAVVLALAFGLRLYRLGFLALTGDEAFSMMAAQRWLRGAMDLYGAGSIESTPPLHYALLAGWVTVAGPSEFSGRYLSAAAGVVLVAGAIALGRSLTSLRLGLLFGLLAAVNPFLVAYAQVARSYSLLACLAVLSTVALVRLLRSGQDSPPLRRFLLEVALYVFATSLVLYSHTFGALLLPFHWLLYLLWPVPRPSLTRWTATQCAIILIAVPWWVRALSLSANPAEMWLERGDVGSRLEAVLRSFAVGPALGAIDPTPLAIGATAALVLVAGAGLIPWGRAWPLPARLGIAWVVGTLAAAVIISWRVPLLRDRFLIVAAPGLLFAVAVGVERIRSVGRPLAAVILAVVVLAAAGGLPPLYSTVPFATTRDVRALLSHVSARQQADSTFVTNLPSTDPFFQYYDPGLPSYYIPDSQPSDRVSGGVALSGLAGRSSDVWLVPFQYGSEVDRFVERDLTAFGFRAEDLWFGNLRLQRYAIGERSAQTTEVGVTFGEGLSAVTLRRISVAPSPARPGDVLRVAATWAPSGPTARPLTVFTHVVDQSGALRAQRDSQPLGGFSPTTTWVSGRMVVDHIGIPLPPELTPGQYRLQIGLYGPGGGRIPTRQGSDAVEVAVLITP